MTSPCLRSELFPFRDLAFDVKVERSPIVLRTDGVSTEFFLDDLTSIFVHLQRGNTAAQVGDMQIADFDYRIMLLRQRGNGLLHKEEHKRDRVIL